MQEDYWTDDDDDLDPDWIEDSKWERRFQLWQGPDGQHQSLAEYVAKSKPTTAQERKLRATLEAVGERQAQRRAVPRAHTGGRFDGQRCPGCGGKKSESWKLCRSCFETYGRKPDGWPDWLRAQIADDRRIRYEAKRKGGRELSLDVFRTLLEGQENGNLAGTAFVDQVITGGELALSRRPKGDPWWPGTDHGWTLLLPWAPYDSEAVNVDYRRSNGIVGRAAAADYLNRMNAALGLVTDDQTDQVTDIEHFDDVTREARAALTDRQQEVLALYLDMENQEAVAQELGLNQSTISRHWTAILLRFEEIGKRYA